MAHQYVYHMHELSKTYALENVNLSFYPNAKIGVLGLNGAGKSTLLRIMAGIDTEFVGEAWAAEGARVGYLPQEPQLDAASDVRTIVEQAVKPVKDALARIEQVYTAYSEPDADFDGTRVRVATRGRGRGAPDTARARTRRWRGSAGGGDQHRRL